MKVQGKRKPRGEGGKVYGSRIFVTWIVFGEKYSKEKKGRPSS